MLQGRSPYWEAVLTHSWQWPFHMLAPSHTLSRVQAPMEASAMSKVSGHGARRASAFCAEPTAVDCQPAGSEQGVPERRPDAALPAGREAPGVTISGLPLSTHSCSRSSLTTLHGTDSPREADRRGGVGRERAHAKVP